MESLAKAQHSWEVKAIVWDDLMFKVEGDGVRSLERDLEIAQKEMETAWDYLQALQKVTANAG